MRVLLPLACVALLVLASGAFADLTPLPVSEWGSVVGGGVGCVGTWANGSKCALEPEEPEAPCDQESGSCTTIAPSPRPAVIHGQPDPGSYKISVDGYLVCESGYDTWKCCQASVQCAHTTCHYASSDCTGTPHEYTMGKYSAAGCNMSARR